MSTDYLEDFGQWNEFDQYIPPSDHLDISRQLLHDKQHAISLGLWKLEGTTSPMGSMKDSLAIMLDHSIRSNDEQDKLSGPDLETDLDGPRKVFTEEEFSLFSNKKESCQFDFFDLGDNLPPSVNKNLWENRARSNSVDADILNLQYAAGISKSSRPISSGTMSEFEFADAEVDIGDFSFANSSTMVSLEKVSLSDSPTTYHEHNLASMSFSLSDNTGAEQGMMYGLEEGSESGCEQNYTFSISKLIRNSSPRRQCPTPPQDLSKVRQGRISKRPRTKTKLKRSFDYSYSPVKFQIEPALQLQNKAKLPDPGDTGHESQLVMLQDQKDCVINRTRYIRGNLECLVHLHKNVVYEKNEFFNVSHPYQQEFTRVETDQTGLPINETRSGLCPYCMDLSFYELKNSSYAQHLSHSHGIFTDNFLTPNPLNIGHYAVAKSTNSPRKTTARVRSHEGVVCPACYKVVEIRCWTSTLEKKPLSNYLRHFKEEHRVGKNRSSYFREHA